MAHSSTEGAEAVHRSAACAVAALQAWPSCPMQAERFQPRVRKEFSTLASLPSSLVRSKLHLRG
jgi:hypothetical protein